MSEVVLNNYQPVEMQLAVDAIVSAFLANSVSKKENTHLLTELIKYLGTIKWRRMTTKMIRTIYQQVGDLSPSSDSDSLEWLMPAFARFIENVLAHAHLEQITERMIKTLVMMGRSDLPEHLSLNVPANELKDTLGDNPMIVFLYCIYHSDIRRITVG